MLQLRIKAGKKDAFYEELGRVLDFLAYYSMKAVLWGFNAKLGREDIFKPTTSNEIYTRVVMIVVLE
jgi:hypothetical protein